MATMTIHYDARNKDAQFLANFIKSLSYVTVEDVAEKPKKNALDRADDDIKAGRVYKAKDGHDLIEQCLK
ncbi:MAG: hypothetical protein MJZ85_00220 [Bacteroidales bacterium]|nr:hypothetical protein [Bacteroidales bacterium]